MTATGAVTSGCFAPGAGGEQDELTETSGDVEGDSDDGSESLAESTDDGTGGPNGDGDGASESGTTGDPGAAQSTGLDTGDGLNDDGASEDGEDTGLAEADGGRETGEQCERPLGTDTDCLACDDECDADQACSPDGCAATAQVGFDTPFTGVGGYPNRLWGFPIDVDSDAWLTHLNFHAVGNGGDVQLALFDDAGGVPGQLLAASDVLENYVPGDYALEVDVTELAAGTYWLMARNTQPSQLGLNFVPNVVPTFEVTAMDLAFDAPLPDVFVETLTHPSFEINLWATVLE